LHVADGECQVVLLEVDEHAADPSAMFGHSFCDGDHADIPNVPPGKYRVCIDEKHCAVVTASSGPPTQRVEIQSKP